MSVKHDMTQYYKKEKPESAASSESGPISKSVEAH